MTTYFQHMEKKTGASKVCDDTDVILIPPQWEDALSAGIEVDEDTIEVDVWMSTHAR